MKIFILLLCLLSIGFSQSLVVGYTYIDETDWYATAPSSDDKWKSFRVIAVDSGIVEYIRMYVGGGTSNTADVGWALYADDNGAIDSLMVSGYEASYDFSTIGVGHHTFNITNTIEDQVIKDSYYWLTWYTEANASVLIGRGRVSGCNSPTPKKGTNTGTGDASSPPDPSLWVIDYAEGCYSWACWGTLGSGDPPAANEDKVGVIITIE